MRTLIYGAFALRAAAVENETELSVRPQSRDSSPEKTVNKSEIMSKNKKYAALAAIMYKTCPQSHFCLARTHINIRLISVCKRRVAEKKHHRQNKNEFCAKLRIQKWKRRI